MSDLSDFGENVIPQPRRRPGPDQLVNAESTTGAATPFTMDLCQFTVAGSHEFLAVGPTVKTLPIGVFSVHLSNRGIVFSRSEIKVDGILELPGSIYSRVLGEIEYFWSRADQFAAYNFLHRRGYLLYGPAGGGKTCIVQQVLQHVVSTGGIVMLCHEPAVLLDALSIFRRVDKERRIVCVFEDIDSIIDRHGEDVLLSLLDGAGQIDRVLNLATTNYPERLDRRLVSRPRRFDRVIKVGMPDADVRRVYLNNKLGISGDELDLWVQRSDGFSFAALAEMVISSKCLGNSLDDTVSLLRSMMKDRAPSSDEFSSSKIGLHA